MLVTGHAGKQRDRADLLCNPRDFSGITLSAEIGACLATNCIGMRNPTPIACSRIFPCAIARDDCAFEEQAVMTPDREGGFS